MLRVAARLLLLCLALLLLTPSATVAFEVIGPGPTWRNGQVTYRINPNFPDEVRSGDVDTQIELLRCAAAAWRDQTDGDFEFVYGGTTGRVGFDLDDGVHAISFSSSDGGEALAATVLDYIGTRALAFDVVFFNTTAGSTNRWNGPRDPGTGTIDIVGVGVHELGHALGLDHSAITEATMFASARGRGLPLRTLHPDDLDGLRFLYGARGAFDTSPSILRVLPDFGPTSGGNSVVLEGRNFTWTADTTLRIGGASVPRDDFNVDHCGRLVILDMPARAAGLEDVELVNEHGSTLLAEGYRYGGPGPQLGSVSPTSAPLRGGVPVTIRGSRFEPGVEVRFGAAPLADLVVVDDTTITGVAPAFPVAGAVDISATLGEASTVLEAAFTYRAKTIRVVDTSVAAGAERAPVEMRIDTDEDLAGVSFGVVYDRTAATIADISVEGTVAADADFAAANIDNDTGEATYGIVMAFVGTEPSILAGEDLHVASLLLDVPEDAPVGESTTIEPRGQVGFPPVELQFTPVADPSGVEPLALSGTVAFEAGGGFVRGDANSSDLVDLSDPIAILDSLFRGAGAPDCDDAADANDDGGLDISDAVYLLLFLFGGGDAPPAPFPNPGVDPTEDLLGC